jgi:NADH dehydrogenase FAD-containing subunit
MNTKKKIVVLGAGYAGLMAATRLAKVTGPEQADIVLVNASATFDERTRNHQVAAAQPVRQAPIEEFLNSTRITFLQAMVTGLRPGQRTVVLEGDAGPGQIAYDYLVYALGSHVNTEAVPRADQYAYTLDFKPASALAQRLPALAAQNGRVLLVGGGNTGVETATELAESFPGLRVTLATRRSLARQLSAKAQAHIRRAFKRLDIEFLENTEVIEVRQNDALTRAGAAIPFDACAWVGGFAVPDLARRAGLQVNERGQIAIDRAMRSLSHPEIYAVGDAAHPAEDPGTPVRMGLYSSIMMGGHGADCLAAQINGKEPKPFGLSYVALGLSLGRRDGVWQFLDWNSDRPLNMNYYGRAANWSREFFVMFAPWVIKVQRSVPWVFEWPGRRKLWRRAAVSEPRPEASPPATLRRTAAPRDG